MTDKKELKKPIVKEDISVFAEKVRKFREARAENEKKNVAGEKDGSASS